jgi:hypothetical protein
VLCGVLCGRFIFNFFWAFGRENIRQKEKRKMLLREKHKKKRVHHLHTMQTRCASEGKNEPLTL